MSVTYAGIPIRQPTRRQERWVKDNVDPADVWDFTRKTDRRSTLANFPFAGLIKTRPVSPHTLYWPTGATRWAIGYFLATDQDLAQIRPQVYGQAGGMYQAQPLVMGDGTNAITASLFMLPSRPLSYAPGGNQLYLLTLVDLRYYWYELAGVVSVTAGTTTWAQLYQSLGTILGVTINADPVNANYLTPDGSFTTNYEDAPVLLDACAWSCGQRVVLGLDGTVHAYNVTTSQTSVANQLALGYPVKAGGVFALTPGSFASAGGQTSDLAPILPAGITVTYPKAVDNHLQTPPAQDAYTATLAGLNLADFAGVSPHGGSRVYHDTAVANYHAGSPTNATQLQNLTNQIATDAYRYAASRLDVVFNGVVPWTPEGLSDSIEWYHGTDGCATRVTRQAWNDQVEELLHFSVTGDPAVYWDYAVAGIGSLVDQMCGQGIKTFQAVNFGQGTSTPNATDMKMAWDGNSASRTVLLQGHDGNKASLSVKGDVISQQHVTSRTSTTPPTVAAGPGAGTGPTVSVVGTDVCGLVTVTTGTAPAGVQSRIVRVTPNATFAGSCVPIITPANNNAAALAAAQQPTAQTTGGLWDIISGNTALAAGTTYVWNYHCIEYAV